MQACRSGLKSRHVASERSRRLLSVVAWCEPSEISSFLLLFLVLHCKHVTMLSHAFGAKAVWYQWLTYLLTVCWLEIEHVARTR
jgi:hypothetical protein